MTVTVDRIIKNFLSEVSMCVEFNQPFSAATQMFTERVMSSIFGFTLDPKKGYAFDTSSNDELKSCNYLQPKKCSSCGESNNFFSVTCNACGHDKFGSVKGDSRWNIDSDSHFKHFNDLNKYLLTLVDYVDGKILMKAWIVKKENPHFNRILRNQLDSAKSDGLNFLPYSHDFFMSDPTLFCEIKMDFITGESDIKIDIDSDKIYEVTKDHFQMNEAILSRQNLMDLLGDKAKKSFTKDVLLDLLFDSRESIKLSDLILPERVKSLGRERGNTKR